MALFDIEPALPESPAFTQETDLDGTTYRLTFRWNVREGYWYLDLADSSGILIAGGLKLVPGALLLRYITDSRRPPGELFVFNTPTRDNLGKDAQLVYADEDEVSS